MKRFRSQNLIAADVNRSNRDRTLSHPLDKRAVAFVLLLLCEKNLPPHKKVFAPKKPYSLRAEMQNIVKSGNHCDISLERHAKTVFGLRRPSSCPESLRIISFLILDA